MGVRHDSKVIWLLFLPTILYYMGRLALERVGQVPVADYRYG